MKFTCLYMLSWCWRVEDKILCWYRIHSLVRHDFFSSSCSPINLCLFITKDKIQWRNYKLTERERWGVPTVSVSSNMHGQVYKFIHHMLIIFFALGPYCMSTQKLWCDTWPKLNDVEFRWHVGNVPLLHFQTVLLVSSAALTLWIEANGRESDDYGGWIKPYLKYLSFSKFPIMLMLWLRAV